jgi:hypothetical protein
MTVSMETAKRPAHAAHKSGTLSSREQGVLWDLEELLWTSGADNARAATANNVIMIFHIRLASSRVTRSGPI